MDKIDFGKKLKTLRKNEGLSQAQLAKKMNVSNKLISKWENGMAYPSVEYLQMYSQIFSISIDSLMDNKVNYECAIDYDKVLVKHKKIGPQIMGVIASIVVVLLYIISAFTSVFVVPNSEFPIWAKVIVAIIPTVIMISAICIAVSRIKEIKGGEEDDSSKY